MQELPVQFRTDIHIAGTLCLPESCSREYKYPAVVLLAGTGGDSRDGDMSPERTPGGASIPQERLGTGLPGTGKARG